jgi:transcriptional regulator with XRE-family HTH domain
VRLTTCFASSAQPGRWVQVTLLNPSYIYPSTTVDKEGVLMATVNNGACVDSAPESSRTGVFDDQQLHRISEVRREQGVSLRAAARRMGTEVSRLKVQERGDTDLKLSDLYQWQQVLDVPVADLLVEQHGPLSRPVMERAKMVRLMKTAAALVEQSNSAATRRMAQTLVEQLVDIMPELAQVSPWHTVGQRRSLDEFGRAYDRRISDDMFHACLSD